MRQELLDRLWQNKDIIKMAKNMLEIQIGLFSYEEWKEIFTNPQNEKEFMNVLKEIKEEELK